MKQHNNHARSKQKRKKLRLKNFWQRVFDQRDEKRLKSLRKKGRTIQGPAKKFAMDYHKLFPDDNGKWLFDHGHAKDLNQRQKRKRKLCRGRY